MYKIAKILAIILGVVGLVLWVMIVRLGEFEVQDSNMVDMMIGLGKWMTIILAVVTILFAIYQLITHPDKLKKALISLVAFAVILIVCYFVLSTGTDIDLNDLTERGIDVTEGASKMVGAGLWAFYILALIAVLAMLFSGVKKLLNR